MNKYTYYDQIQRYVKQYLHASKIVEARDSEIWGRWVDQIFSHIEKRYEFSTQPQ